MKRSLLMVAAVSTLAIGATAAQADDPGYSGNYRIYYELFNGYGQKIGYEVEYCDGSYDIYVQPGNSSYSRGPGFQGDCWEPDPLPFPR